MDEYCVIFEEDLDLDLVPCAWRCWDIDMGVWEKPGSWLERHIAVWQGVLRMWQFRFQETLINCSSFLIYFAPQPSHLNKTLPVSWHNRHYIPTGTQVLIWIVSVRKFVTAHVSLYPYGLWVVRSTHDDIIIYDSTTDSSLYIKRSFS